MLILANVSNQRLYIASTMEGLVDGSQNFVKFRFNLSDDWDGLLTFAQFTQGGVAYNKYLDEENSVYLPPEIKAGTCTLMLYGTHDTTIATTNYLTLKIDKNILVSDATSTEISQSLYDQLVTRVNAVSNWNAQSVADLVVKTDDILAQMNRKADKSDLSKEISRAQAAEAANADAIKLKADQSQVDDLALQLEYLVNNETTAELIGEAVKEEMNVYLESGKLANLIIQDGSVTRSKMDESVTISLDKGDTAMQPDVYDPLGLKTDIYSYAQGRADLVSQNLQKVKDEIADAYELSETLKFTKLGDALRGAVQAANTYTSAMLAGYKAFSIKIVDTLPAAGEDNTFYLVPKTNGAGYDKYWYITDEGGNHMWDVFGDSSTVVVDSLPDVGDTDVDYILKSPSGYLYYKYIDGFWQIIAGSLAYISATLPDVSLGSEFTDYYIVNNDDGSYTHYRFINGAFHVIGGDSYTKDEVNERLSALSDAQNATNQKVISNETNISSLSGTLTKLQQDFNNFDADGYTYYATYGTTTMLSGEVKDNVYTLYQCKDDQEEVVSQFVIAGGGSSGGETTTTNLVVERVTSSPIVATPTDRIKIQFSYSSTDSDGEEVDGTYTWKLGGAIIATGPCIQGLNEFDATEFVNVGTQKLTLTVVDDGGSAAVKNWTVQIVDVRLESSFSDKITYPANKAVNFTYTPYGAVSKTVHFILDGVDLTKDNPVVTTASGALQSYTLPAQPHGAHLLECYITATVNGLDVETQHIFKDIVWFDEDATTPVIGCIYRSDYYSEARENNDKEPGKVYARQYDSTNILYHVFDPATGSPTVSRTADGVALPDKTLTQSADTWSYKTDEIGDHTLVISCKGTSVTIVMAVQELGVDISHADAPMAFDFNPAGLSNSGADRLWTDKDTGVAMSVSDNFDWINGGYQLDADGNQYFCVKAGTEAVINYKLFEQDASVYGSEFKVIFKVDNVRDVDATFLSCVAGDTPVGLRMDAHAAYLMTSGTGADPLYMPYSETDIIEFEFNVNPLDTEDTEATALIMSYEDGTGYRPLLYDASHRLYQYANDAVPITIGSPDCDVHIYRMKAYTTALSDSDILDNFIADARDSETMLQRYDRNAIYDENNALTPEFVAAACPDLKIIKIDAPYFTQDKKEMIKNTTIQCIHKNGDAALDNWTARNCYHSGQGTTSNEYGYAGRNLNIYMCFDGTYTNKNCTYDPSYITELTMGDGTKYTDGTGKVTLTRGSIPNALFNIKVNIASSENANNALLAQRYHRYLPYTPVSSKRNPNAKTTMEFVNCVVFVRENDSDLSTHREFQDTDWHFYALGNIGDSKDTDQTRANDPDDHNEFVIEISDNTKPNSIFPTGVTDSEGKMVYPISESQWKAGNTAYDNLYGNWNETFEFRYTHPDITAEEEAAGVQIWNDMYKWMITSSDEEFVAELGDWFIVDAALYMYLFTERYTMLDNRAKNTFWHWGKVYISDAEARAMGEEKAAWFTLDNEKAAIHNGYRFDFWDYDNDTSLGINNSGEMTQPYGREDIDYRTDGDPSSGYVFNAAESVFFRRIRKLMYSQLAAMYLSRETANAWSATGLINEFDNWQNQFCEELWRLDTERKYYRTYYGGTKRFLETMMNGRKRYHRRQWERDQEAYMGTKYVSANVKRDQIMFRCNTPIGAVVTPNYDLSIIPYSDMYLSVLYGNSLAPIQIRAKAGQTYTIRTPDGFTTMDDTAILIYCASRIQALNDLSGCYIHDNDFSKASKLQKLTIGNNIPGYSNAFMTGLNIGNNTLLQELNIRNCPNLIGSINLTSCGNLERLYAEGTAITGVTFATSGKIVSAYLPDTINTLTMKNLNYLTDLQVSCDNLETLTEENSVVDEKALVEDAIDTLQTLRLTGINWVLPDTAILNQILKMDSSYLSGYVYISGPIRNQEIESYSSKWPDLTVEFDAKNLVTQYLATYINADDKNTVLYQVYVDRGSAPPDPYAEKWIEKPTLSEDAQYTYEFGTTTDGNYVLGSGWDEINSEMLSSRTITAVYTKTPRTYTVTWYAREGLPLGSATASYGSEVTYTGDIPTNETEESSYIYNVFAGWNASTGFITGDTDVYAIWERAYLPVEGKDMKDMTPGEIYAVTKSGKTENYFVDKDYTDLALGHDFEFVNVDSEVIAENLYLDGKTAIDTNITLFGDNDRSFTLAIDFQFTDMSANNTLLSCYEEDEQKGFRLRYNGYPNIQWGDAVHSFGNGNLRDIVVLRHRKGEDKLYVYVSNATGSANVFSGAVSAAVLTRTRNMKTDSVVTLGAIRFLGDGSHANYGTGFVHWCKIWYEDIGETNARQLASWYHEPCRIEYYGSGRYFLPGGSSQRTSASFIFNNLLGGRSMQMNGSRTNVGGWDECYMRTFLNSRLKDAMPTVWQSMLKKARIKASAGDLSSDIVTSDDYIYIPCVREMGGSTAVPYINEGDSISWCGLQAYRLKFSGLIIPDDAIYYTVSSDPSSDAGNTVRSGDVWQKNGNGNGYIYVDQTYLTQYAVTPSVSAYAGGGWIAAAEYWLRSPAAGDSGNNTSFNVVNALGFIGFGNGVATGYKRVCPCFNI